MNTENTTKQTEQSSPETSTEIFDSVSSAQPTPETELTDLKSENDRLRSELRMIAAHTELTRLLATERARSPELLFEASRDRLTFDDNGKLTGTDELIDDLKHRFPEQFVSGRSEDTPVLMSAEHKPVPPTVATGVPSINSGAGRSNSRSPLTKDQLARMKPREITRLNWNEVKHVLSS